MRADLIVLGKSAKDPYAALIAAAEGDLSLVVIDGVARHGTPKLLAALEAPFVAVEVAGKERGVQYHDASANPDIDSLSLSDARATLKDFFGNLGNPKPAAKLAKLSPDPKPKVHLVLNELDTDKAQRHRLTFQGEPTGWKDGPRVLAATAALPLENLDIDPLTVHDDPKFVPSIAAQSNLPAWMKTGLTKAHR